MATVELARAAGACFGVQRALGLVEEAIRTADGRTVRTLGPLIHNPQVVEEFAAQGVGIAQDVPDDPGSILVLRSHGVVPELEQRARDAGLEVVDATCPFVKRCHFAARRLQSEGYQVVVVGEKGHPEVEATAAYAPGSIVLSTPEDADAAELSRKVAVVVQTTLALRTLQDVLARMLGRVDELRVMNTICSATSERQQAAAELASRADVMVVIGGRASANTTHLAQICAESCPRTHHIETVDELEAEWFEGAELVGVTAGASTPASQIDALVGAIARIVA